MLYVSASDKGTGNEQNIEASSGLTEEEIKKIKEEAEANAELDKKERERAEKLNTAESLSSKQKSSLKRLVIDYQRIIKKR